MEAKTVDGSRWSRWIKVALALLVLNFLISFNNLWPTPMVLPDTRIAPELVGLWVILLLLVAASGRIGRFTITLLTGVFFLLVIGRYADVTVPALLGRKMNLYWDAYHLPKFLEVAGQALSWWQIIGIVAGVFFGLWLLIRLVRVCIEILARHAAPTALRSPTAWVVTVCAVGLVAADFMRVPAASPFVAGPVLPVYKRQADLLLAAYLPGGLQDALPASPPLDSDLKVLGGADVKVIFLESYGATTYERPEIAEVVGPARERFEQAANAEGRVVLSAFVRAATFGGASDLSHLSLLSGIDLTDPFRHDVLLTTDRKTMLDTFKVAGYRTIGLYPAMSWDWPEKSFYGFDHYYDGPSLEYQGPPIGLWWLPDQFSLARINEIHPPNPTDRPRFLFYPTITSHIPYGPTPPYQPDWSLVTSDHPFTDDAMAAATVDENAWAKLLSGYISTMRYTFEWLAGYQAQPQARDSVMIVLGDHQPAGGITGPNANWNVPVHIITSNQVLAERLRQRGFVDGVNPRREALGHISGLNQILLSAFDSGETLVASAVPAEGQSTARSN